SLAAGGFGRAPPPAGDRYDRRAVGDHAGARSARAEGAAVRFTRWTDEGPRAGRQEQAGPRGPRPRISPRSRPHGARGRTPTFAWRRSRTRSLDVTALMMS